MSKGTTFAIIAGMSFTVWGCGGTRKRGEDVSFKEKSCGSTTAKRDPSPEVTKSKSVLSAKAFQTTEGDLRILISPIVDQDAKTVKPVTAENVTIVCGSVEHKPTEVIKVSAEKPAATDIVFVLDTTGSMAWLINGMIDGVTKFAENIGSLGLDARLGGIDFGDEIRAKQDLTDPKTFSTWVQKLGELAGGDGPENPIDAMLHAYENFSFRRDAQKYFLMITDAGMHEKSDETECADNNLATLVEKTKGDVLFGIASSAADSSSGVHPKEITNSLGGLYVQLSIKPFQKNDFDLSKDTNFDGFLADTVRVEVPASVCAVDPNGGDPRSDSANLIDKVTVRYRNGSELYESEVPLLPVEG